MRPTLQLDAFPLFIFGATEFDFWLWESSKWIASRIFYRPPYKILIAPLIDQLNNRDLKAIKTLRRIEGMSAKTSVDAGGGRLERKLEIGEELVM